MLRTVLVTGGAGFIGSHLVEALANRGVEKVIVLDNLSCGYRENIPKFSNIQFVLGDIRDVSLMDQLTRKSDLIFHLAEYIPQTSSYGPGHVVKYSSEKPLEDFEVNTKGTLIVLNAARKYRKKVVFSSTAAVYGNIGLRFLREDCKPQPVSPYGAGKLSAEIYADLYSRVYGLPIVVARLFNVYGPRQRKYLMYDLLLRISKAPKQLDVLGNGKEERDFIFVQDAVNALMLVATHPEAEGDVFNVGTGVATPISKVVELLLRMLNVNAEVKFSGSSWQGDVRTLVANIDKITALGFKPQFSLEAGLKKFITWFFNTHEEH